MEAFLSLFEEAVVLQFALLFGRIMAFIAFMPVFSHAAIPVNIKITIAFFLSVFLFPIVDIQTQITQDTFMIGLLAEITLGLVASMFVNIIFASVRIIGEFIGFSTALSMAMLFDPATGSQEGIISKLLFWIALMIYFQTGMYEMTIVMLVKSFSMIHLGAFDLFSFNGIAIAIDEIKRMFGFALAFALPLFFIGFIIDLYYGYGTRSMPAFSPFVITMQLKFAFIFIFMIMSMELFFQAFTDYFIDKFK